MTKYGSEKTPCLETFHIALASVFGTEHWSRARYWKDSSKECSFAYLYSKAFLTLRHLSKAAEILNKRVARTSTGI